MASASSTKTAAPARKGTTARNGAGGRRLSAHAQGGITESNEDYLETIQNLIEQKGYARVSDIADELGLSRPSVSIMVKRLGAQGYLKYERYRGLTLTPKGRRVAREIQHRHETLSRFFEQLGLTKKEIGVNVEGIEHHVTPALLNRLNALVGYWERNPTKLRAVRQAKPAKA